MGKYPLPRRQLLSIAGGVVAIGLAGCLGGGDEDDGDKDSTDKSDDHDHEHDDHSHEHDHDDEHELGHPEEQFTIQMETDEDSHHFRPHVVHIKPGGTVEWELTSGEHNTVAYHPDNEGELPSIAPSRIPEDAEPWASDMLTEQGETFEREFEVEGVYDYVCTPHEARGMTGRVIVGWPDPDPDAEPALESPQEGLPDSARQQFEEYNQRTIDALEE